MKKQEFKKKNEERLRDLWDSFKHSNIQIIRTPEGEQEKQIIENLVEKIMKANFPNLAKEMGFRESRKLRVPKKLDPMKHTPTTS